MKGTQEVKNKLVIGETRDIIRYRDGRVVDLGWGRNTIVLNFNTLIACLLKGEVGFLGAKFWAVGSGLSSWDTPSVYEVAQLVVTAGAGSSSNVTVTLNGVGTTVAVTSGDTATGVATKIRNTAFAGWVTGGTGTTVTFTCNTDGNKTDASYSAGTTGATGSMTTTTQGVTGIPRPSPAEADTGCTTEFYRKAILAENIKFIDGAGAETLTPTNRVEISMVFSDVEAVGSWREFAIFGGNATSSLGSGLAINHRTHGLIAKTNAMSVERIIRFTFN